jgi:hypothetical protein
MADNKTREEARRGSTAHVKHKTNTFRLLARCLSGMQPRRPLAAAHASPRFPTLAALDSPAALVALRRAEL